MLAQVITPDAEEAARLVEATYRRAHAALSEKPQDGNERAWMLRLLIDTQRAQQEDMPASDDALGDLHGRLIKTAIDRALPAAFVALPVPQRLLLMLCDVEGLPPADTDGILDVGAESADEALDRARLALKKALYANLTELERYLLRTNLPPAWQAEALQRMVQAELVPLPPTLRPSIKAAAHVDEQRVPTSPSATRSAALPARTRRRRRSVPRIASALLTILIAGSALYFSSSLVREAPDANLITLSASQAASIAPSFQTVSPEQAERYVYDQLGWRITVPDIDQATLTGVTIREITAGVEVPVLLFEDTAGQLITLYAYSYRLLDQHAQITLEKDILRQIEQDGHFDLHDLGAAKALVWRHRDDIFIAVTNGSADALRDRIYFPS